MDYYSILWQVEKQNIFIFAIVILLSIIIIVSYKLTKNNFLQVVYKVDIVCIVLCSLFLAPQTVAILLDVNNQDSIKYENCVEYNINNNMSTANGFDYLHDYNTVTLQNGDKLLIVTAVKKLPDGIGEADIVYAEHSRILLDYNISGEKQLQESTDCTAPDND